MSTPEVVVTGLGMTTPVGGHVASSWSAILAGQSGVRPIDAEWIAEQPSRIAGQLAVEPSEVLTKVETRRLDRSQQAAVIAAREAWQDAGAPRWNRAPAVTAPDRGLPACSRPTTR